MKSHLENRRVACKNLKIKNRKHRKDVKKQKRKQRK